MSTTDTVNKPKIDSVLKHDSRLQLKEPKLFKVIFVNDEITTMEFIVTCLTSIFRYEESAAQAKTMQIHEDGACVVAVYPFEIAEQKGIEATLLARTHGFPLQIKLEMEA